MAKARAGKVITYADGRWRNGSPAILSAKSHAMWLASVAFDGARAFAGVAPDLDRHCARLVHSGARGQRMFRPSLSGPTQYLAERSGCSASMSWGRFQKFSWRRDWAMVPSTVSLELLSAEPRALQPSDSRGEVPQLASARLRPHPAPVLARNAWRER